MNEQRNESSAAQEQAWPTPEPPAAIIAAERLSDALTTVRRLGTIRVTMVGGQPK